jgi:hypothetical protein
MDYRLHRLAFSVGRPQKKAARWATFFLEMHSQATPESVQSV